MATLGQFSKRIAQIGARVAERADVTVRATALAVDQTAVMATPVDTGRARSNWIVELNAPRRATVEPYSPGTGGSTAGANTTAALEQGRAVISTYNGLRDSAIAISNNLPYIGRLNEGSSAQAPAGFVQKAVQSGVREVRKARLVR